MIFSYTARSKTGESCTGSLDAESRQSAMHKLEKMGLIPVSLQNGATTVRTNSPNLIACPACGNMVSKAASQCPSCAHPLQEKSYMTKDLGFGGFVYSVIIGIGIMMLIVGWARWAGLLITIIGSAFLILRMRMWSGAAPK